MEKIKTAPAPILSRFIAFIIDIFIVHIIRFFYVNLTIRLWLFDSMQAFAKKYYLLYGEFDPNKMTKIEIDFFLKSNLFKHLILFIIGIFCISLLYNFILLCTKWSATIGQRVMKLKVIKNNGNKIGFINIILRSIFIIVPWIFLAIFIINEILAEKNLTMHVDKLTFLLAALIFVSWYDLVFFTKDRLTFHDYLSFTKVVRRETDSKNTKSNKLYNFLFPNFAKLFSDMKNDIKNMFNKFIDITKKVKKEKKLSGKSKVKKQIKKAKVKK